MSPRTPQLAVEDCDEAIKINKTYVKAINRRGIALEALERYDEALNDFIITASLDVSANTSALHSVDRILRKLAVRKAAEIFDMQVHNLPPLRDISAYFASFRHQPSLGPPDRVSSGDAILLRALQAFDVADYGNAMLLVNEALEDGISISWRSGRARARNMRGTFRYLVGNFADAKADFLSSLAIVPNYTQNFVKLARIHTDEGEEEAAFKCFDDAIMFDANDPDIYHHRGQVFLGATEYTLAAENFAKSIALDRSFIWSHSQLAAAQCRAGNIDECEVTLLRTMELFPEQSEPFNYYGELLLHKRRYEAAIEMFDCAYELEKLKEIPNLASLINKSRALFQWNQDIDAAQDCCSQVLETEPENVAAISLFSEISLALGDFEDAITRFEQLLAVAHSKTNIAAVVSCQYACAAHMKFLEKYSDLSSELQAFAREKHLKLIHRHLSRLQHSSISDLTAGI
ncbi:hypothetical protein H0H87_006721 [Tephrocybe sp. NHM501043]|nr:hypothetical protein H0H87_006721 [Tephrocybe sp. NHM501043]